MVGLFLALVIALAGCGASSKTLAAGPGAAAASGREATVKIRDKAADLRAQTSSTFAPAHDGHGVAVGNTVIDGLVSATPHGGTPTQVKPGETVIWPLNGGSGYLNDNVEGMALSSAKRSVRVHTSTGEGLTLSKVSIDGTIDCGTPGGQQVPTPPTGVG